MISIWLTPAEEDSEYLQNIITDLASKYQAPVFSPHCTLYSPTDLAPDELEKVLQKISYGIKPFVVNMVRLHQTDIIWKTVFIELEMSAELSKLNHQFEIALPNPNHTPYSFSPHISLIYKEMSDEKKETIICNLSVRNNYKMDRISAMKTGPDVENWEKVVEVQLYA